MTVIVKVGKVRLVESNAARMRWAIASEMRRQANKKLKLFRKVKA